MRKKEKMILLVVMAFFLAILVRPLFADTTISGITRCRLTHAITMSEEQIIAAEAKNTEQISETKKNSNSNTILQQEEVISEETEEVELINTVCAR
ncbi:hypothetical protein ACFL2J_02475 [Candidatus Omnitrophota bacterium]